MASRKIFFDLDGTLIDSTQRLYLLFVKLSGIKDLSYEDYWAIKRKKKDHRYILDILYKWSPGKISEFINSWMADIEAEEWLMYDKAFDQTAAILSGIPTYFDLYIVTARQSETAAINQLQKLGLSSFFKNILVTRNQTSKTALVLQHVNTTVNDIFVGDTGSDIQTAKELNCISVAVTCGFRSRQDLETYRPDYIFENIADPLFHALLLKHEL